MRHAHGGLNGGETGADVTAGLTQLLDDGALRRQVAVRGRALALGNFTWESVATDLITIYEELLTSNPHLPAAERRSVRVAGE